MMKSKVKLVTQAIIVLGLLSVTGIASAQNWVKQSDMKVARVEATTVDYRGDIYVFNGFKAGIRIADSVEKYDVATKKWSIISSTTTMNGSAVTHNGVVRVGADVWIIGGRIGSHPGRVSDLVWIYNLDKKKWRRGPDLPMPGAAGGAALVNNKIHWFGGIDAHARCDVNTHLVYDLSKPAAGWNNITAKAGMPSPRNHFSTAAVGGIIYAMGGQYGHDGCPGKSTQDTTLVHAFNPKTNKWSRKADLPSKNSHTEPGTFVYKGDIYTTGGENAQDKVWKYNPRTNKWSTFKTLPEKLVAPIARIVDGNLIVAGGGAPIARNAVNTVRSIRVDNNPPAVESAPVEQVSEIEPTQEPKPTFEPELEPEPTPEPIPGSQKPKGDTLISMEAEYFDINKKTSSHQWVRTVLGNSSNDDAMVTTPDEGQLAGTPQNTPMLSYMVYFNHPGKHYIWVRGLGDTNKSGNGNSDSIQIGLNGKLADTAYRIDQFPDSWTWSRHTPSNPVASLNVVNAGVNMVNIWMREDGLAIDKFVITSDPKFVPTGFGPDVTDGTKDYVPPVTAVAVDTDSDTANDDSADNNASNNDPADTDLIKDDLIKDDLVETDLADEISNSSELSNDEPIENETDGSAQEHDTAELNDSIQSDSIVIDLEKSDTADIDDVAVGNDETVPAVSVIADVESNNGVFGGSASMMTLFMLLALCLIRTGRSRKLCRVC